ncbi:MAG: glycosyltransferase [Bacteroidales bacterium]|nr:glycosyltransferase [Bacteroidales bacterium]
MKVLQLTIKPPYPPVDGGSLAMNSVTQGLLSQDCEVRVLSMCSKKHPVQARRMTEEYKAATRFDAVEVDLRVRPLPALWALLRGKSYNVARFESKAFADRLRELLAEEHYDVVHLESLFLTPYVPVIRQCSDAKVVLRAHNVEYRIWRRRAEYARNPLKRWYLGKLAAALERYERAHLGDFDGIVCITRHDADIYKAMGATKPVMAMPFGIVTPELAENVEEEPCTLFHIGSMDWMPNVEGVQWFLREVWPMLHAAVPQAKLYLAGRKMPKKLMELKTDGVTVVGEVPDAGYFMSGKQINVVPLLSGSGIRVKIIEAMSLGKTVVATTVAAEGIDYTDGEDLLIADTPEQFVEKIRLCIEQPERCKAIGRKAFDLIAERYDNERLTGQLLDFYGQL